MRLRGLVSRRRICLSDFWTLVQRCEAAPLGAALRQLSILFLLNPSTETKWRTSYDNDQLKEFYIGT